MHDCVTGRGSGAPIMSKSPKATPAGREGGKVWGEVCRHDGATGRGSGTLIMPRSPTCYLLSCLPSCLFPRQKGAPFCQVLPISRHGLVSTSAQSTATSSIHPPTHPFAPLPGPFRQVLA